MKIRNKLIIITVLCLTAFALASCDYWEPADQGSINISFADSNARAASSLVSDMVYTITLTSPGKGTITRTTKEGETFISIPVSGGAWSIQVHGEGARRIGEGTAYADVTAGKPAPVLIRMTVTSTKAYSYEDIVADFKDGSLPNEFIIEIFGEEIIANSYSGKINNTDVNDLPNYVATLSNGKTITLRAKADLTIKRRLINTTIDTNIFRIINGSLILDGETGGKITLDGMRGSFQNGDDCGRALINVEGTSSSKLVMLNRVTLTNNKTGNGGGVYVSGSNSYFYMYGGTISNNVATKSGGGVSVKTNGHFIKTKGIVYGSDTKALNIYKNICSGNLQDNDVLGGDSIYDKEAINITYDEETPYQ